MAEVFPDVRYTPTPGEEHDPALDRHAQRLLAYAAQHSWRDHVEA